MKPSSNIVMNRGKADGHFGVSSASFLLLPAVRVLLLALMLMFGAAIIYALVEGSFWEEGAVILSIPWGVVALVDLYIGFLLFSFFVFATERRVGRACLWVLFLMVFGNMIAAFYLYLWLGRRESGQC